MSWSWSHPSEDEALEAYQYYKGKYSESAYQRAECKRQEQQLGEKRRSVKNQIQVCSSQKINFEERVKGIDRIIKMLDGRGAFLAADVSGAISNAQKSLSDVDQSYKKCIHMTGGVAAASFEEAFAINSVEGDPHSSLALQEFIREKARLETEIENLNRQIANLTSMVESLNAQIAAAADARAALTSAMNSYAYDMNHYKKYTY